MKLSDFIKERYSLNLQLWRLGVQDEAVHVLVEGAVCKTDHIARQKAGEIGALWALQQLTFSKTNSGLRV